MSKVIICKNKNINEELLKYLNCDIEINKDMIYVLKNNKKIVALKVE